MDMNEMMAAAQQAAARIQEQMNEAQAKLDTIEVEGAAGGGMVKVLATAKGRIRRVTIDESLLRPSEKQMVEDLVAAAFNDARTKADAASNEEMGKVTDSARRSVAGTLANLAAQNLKLTVQADAYADKLKEVERRIKTLDWSSLRK